MRKVFYKDNRMVPLGIMLLTIMIFIYHFELDKETALQSIPSSLVPEKLVGEPQTGEEKNNRIVEDTIEAVIQPVHEAAVPSPTTAIIPETKQTTPSSVQHAQSKPPKTPQMDEVVLMFKTGASVLWKRVPIHLATTLSPERIDPNNVLLYSDYPETIGPWDFIDVLANASEKTRSSDNFQPYRLQADFNARQNYAELSNTAGDGPGLEGGWKLDKYKFLPIVQHAGRTKPDAKWYVFMEDDSYIFLPNLVRHLEQFNPQEPWYLGSLAWIHGDYFAHGGSGFALSRGAWEKSFGQDPNIVEKFTAYTEEHGCGDHILGHVLHEYGVEFGETHGDNRWTYGFNADSHWGTWYDQNLWCEPVYSWHHTHGKDVARFYKLEQAWDLEKKGPLRHRDIFHEFVAPYLQPRVEFWDNWSSKYDIRSSNVANVEPPSTVKSPEVFRSSWKSVDACEAACVSWAECVQWSYYEDRCKMDSAVLLGSGIPEGDARRQTSLPWTSGWLKRRIENWKCEEK
ncbi:hypothetical protein FE257_011130 [Aspergillus nanangensis]|uniref:N-acetylgalactosaminide beta-1,3-galactosyltransferase n=1 Tax=Aspergillus nanangensis TaxID=2582783 RepID=A0AAD4GSU4_ASPNN|nr:hypothetical protein FE257_011130 [Aspergillus nanangensis]